MTRLTRCSSAARLFCTCASVISGSNSVESVARNENGKKITGMAMPFSAPYWLSAVSRLSVYSARQPGTITFSTVRSTLVIYWFAAMGAMISHSCRPSPCTGRFALRGTSLSSRR